MVIKPNDKYLLNDNETMLIVDGLGVDNMEID